MRILLVFCLIFCSFASNAEKVGGVYKSPKKAKFYHQTYKASPMGHDTRFKMFTFVENGVYEISTFYDNTCYIEFEQGEQVNTITNPKKDSWQLSPTGNRLFIKPIASDADTSITIMTNKRIYFFEMKAAEPTKTALEDYTFFYQFNYPSDDDQKVIRRYSKSIMPNIETEPEKYNFNYTITGDDYMYPGKIFDDGEFTYFEFRENAPTMPAIFKVDTNGFESIVNFRVVGTYLVVETTSPRFTLRNGADIVCVFNENLYNATRAINQEKNRKNNGFFSKIIRYFRGS